jgi:serine/threonine protein kinase
MVHIPQFHLFSRFHRDSFLFLTLRSFRYRAPEVGLCRGSYSQAIDVFSVGCILAELLHCMPETASAANADRILFNGGECRSESKVYVLPVFANEMLGRFFAVLGKPSQEDVEELARAAGEAAVFIVPATASAADRESTRLQAVEQTVQLLTTGYDTCQGISAPVELTAKYSAAAAECPAAVSLLDQMLAYSPTRRITCSQALQHEFLNPDHAVVNVDGLVGDDGHERAKRTAVKLKQLNIEGLCHHNGRRDRAKIAELLITEAQLIKLPFPLTPRE